ncbi:MAG: hypothetical protein JSR91_01835 [Proteobacteria bacterium]|nr:hypothetical protein [Pseudomonadota bacterium]
MSDPIDSFPSNLGPEAFLARMYGGGLFMPWGVPPTPNCPSLANSIAAMDAGPPSLARSLIAMGYTSPTATPDPSLQPTLDPQEMLFGGPGLPSNANGPSVNPGLIPTGFSPLLQPPTTGPRAISRRVGEPPAQPVDPYDIFARAGLPRPSMSMPVSGSASMPADGHNDASSGESLAFLGPVGAAIRSAAVPAAEAVAAMGVGPLLAALASGAAVLFYPSELGDDSCTPPNCGNQYVLRGGLAAPANLQQGVGVVTGYEPMTGFSVTSAPNMTLDQLAKYAQYPNAMISFTTTRDLANMGYPVAPTPLNRPDGPDPLHSTVQTPMPLPDAEAQAISKAFARKMQNLYKRGSGPGPRRNLSVLDEP